MDSRVEQADGTGQAAVTLDRRLGVGTDATSVTRDQVLTALDRAIARIDTLLNDQVNAILHHPRFQRQEASWRGLLYLVEKAAGASGVKLRVLTVTWAELCRDAERAIDVDQSALFA